MIHQLRIYQIAPHLKQEFNIRFRDHASRIMKSYGFNIVAAWYSEFSRKTEFVYIIQWDNEEIMKKQWNAFLSDQEWIEIKAQTREKYGEMVLDKIRDQVLQDTDWFTNKL